jgi:hypothetical protein
LAYQDEGAAQAAFPAVAAWEASADAVALPPGVASALVVLRVDADLLAEPFLVAACPAALGVEERLAADPRRQPRQVHPAEPACREEQLPAAWVPGQVDAHLVELACQDVAAWHLAEQHPVAAPLVAAPLVAARRAGEHPEAAGQEEPLAADPERELIGAGVLPRRQAAHWPAGVRQAELLPVALHRAGRYQAGRHLLGLRLVRVAFPEPDARLRAVGPERE